MSWMIPFNYYDDPFLKHEPTLEELVDKIGQPAVFAGTDVDTLTQNSLVDFFLLDRLCDAQKRFLWHWRRNLNLYYPIYKQELDMWAERRAEKWFFDNFKNETRQHDGTFKLDEETRVELMRELSRAINDIFASKTHGEGNSSGKTGSTTDSNGSGSDTYNNGSDGKRRQFSFNYPESNYTGGVIPYDLNSNPNVEFISTQGDGLDKSTDTHNGSDENEAHSETDGTRSDEYTQNGTTDNTSDQKTAESAEETTSGTRGQETATHWIETLNRQGDNLNALATELIAQIPETNFWKKFTSHLKCCFQQTYLVDELLEEDDIDV